MEQPRNYCIARLSRNGANLILKLKNSGRTVYNRAIHQDEKEIHRILVLKDEEKDRIDNAHYSNIVKGYFLNFQNIDYEVVDSTPFDITDSENNDLGQVQRKRQRVEETPEFPKVLTYDAPGNNTPSWYHENSDDDDDDDGEEEEIENKDDHQSEKVKLVEEFDFYPVLPPLERLAGIYDLIFYSTKPSPYQGFSAQHRVIEGSMELILAMETRKMTAVLKMPDEVMTKLLFYDFWDGDIKIEFNERGNAQHVNIKARKNSEDLEGLDGDIGKVQCVREPKAVRYMPEYDPYKGGKCMAGEREREYAKSIDFESVEEARRLLKVHHQTHLTSVTKIPPPVFIFEEGDICLSFPKDLGYNIVSYRIVARPRRLFIT